jgi:hypothetical protein
MAPVGLLMRLKLFAVTGGQRRSGLFHTFFHSKRREESHSARTCFERTRRSKLRSRIPLDSTASANSISPGNSDDPEPPCFVLNLKLRHM